MSGRPKIPATEYTQNGDVVQEYSFTKDALKKYYGGDRPIWNIHPNIHILPHGNILARRIRDVKEIVDIADEIIKNRKIRFNRVSRPIFETKRVYRGMINRCKKNSKSAKYYFDRGISVCERWMLGFENFYQDMGIRPAGKYSIDRIDVSKGYYKENCRWATIKTQANNKTNNVKIVFNGEIITASDFCKIIDRKINTVYHHISSGRTGDEIYSLIKKEKKVPEKTKQKILREKMVHDKKLNGLIKRGVKCPSIKKK